MSDLLFPFRGLSDELARGVQEPMTTPDAVNARGKDGTTNRMRGGSREGVSRVSGGTLNGANPVRELQVMSFDQRGATYAQYAQGAAVTKWSKETPLKQGCAATAIDVANNRFAIDGRAGVAMFNAAGELVWKFVLPVSSQEHIVRALATDSTGAFYVAVSEGFPQEGARVWKFRARDSGAGEPLLEWEIPLDIGGYVERIRIRQGYMFLACNFPDRGAAEIRAYRQIDTSVPELAWTRTQVPYPINSLDVRDKDGALLSCHEANSTRGYDRRSPDTQRAAIDWTWERLTDYDKRAWSWHAGWDIDGDGSFNSEHDNGDPIVVWVDKTGHNRNYYALDVIGLVYPAGTTAPTLSKDKTFGGYDTVQFAASTTVINTSNQITSATNTTTAASFGDSQLTTIPGYVGAWWAMWIVLRVENDAVRNWVLGVNPNGAQTEGMMLFVNANDATGNAMPPTADAGSTFWYVRGASAGAGSGGQPNAADYDNTHSFVLVGICHKADGTADGSSLSIMGAFTEDGFTSAGYTAPSESFTAAVQMGRMGATTASNASTAPSANVFGLRGKVAEVRVLRDYTPPGGSKTICTKDEFQRVEGELAWRYGIAHKLDAAHPYFAAPPTDDPLPGTSTSAYTTLTDTEAMLVKWDPNKARPRWIVKDDTSGTGTGGLGYECGWPQSGNTEYCFSHGLKGTGTGGTTAQILTRESVVRRIADNGDSASVTGSGTFESRWGSAGAAAEPSYKYPKACVSGIAANTDALDDNNQSVVHWFLPVHTSTGPSTDALYIYLQAGSSAGTNADTPELRTIAVATGARGYSASVEAFMPEYQPGLNVSTIDRFVFIGTPREGSDTEAVHNVELVQETIVNTNPRATYVLAACSTGLRRLTGAGTVSTPTGGGVLSGGNYVSIVSAFSKFWVADGTGFYYVDPRAANGITKPWKSKTAGTLPPNARLLAYWGERLAATRGEDPSRVFFSGVAAPFDWNLFPTSASDAQSTFVSIGEPVNGLMPLSDDLLLIGTQSRLMRLTGNPAVFGYSLDRVGDVSGMAFGEAWCKSPEGMGYFFGGRGGVYETDGASVRPIDGRIRRRLEDIDLSLYFVRMAWSWRMGGLYVVLCPQSGTGTSTRAFFWDRAADAWWEDSLPFVVTSLRLVDADDGAGRVLWMGCSDGHVRRFNENATTDDGTPLSWRFAMGPFVSDGMLSTMVSRPRLTLASELGDAYVGLMVSEDGRYPSSEAVEEGTIAGLGAVVPIRARGAQVWVRVRGSGRMGYESGTVEAVAMGIRRPQ